MLFMEKSLVVRVCVGLLGRGVENEGREGILVRISVEGSGEKNVKNEMNDPFSCTMVLVLLLFLHFYPFLHFNQISPIRCE